MSVATWPTCWAPTTGLLALTSVNDVRLRARRPVYCALSNEKLAAAIGRPLPTWQDAVARYVATLG